MKPRKFKYRIEVFKTVIEDDGFGGNHAKEGQKIGCSWCNVSTIPRDKLTDFGLDEVKGAIRVRVRKRNDLDYNEQGLFFKYKGDRYTINSVTEINLAEYHFEIIAST